MSDRIDHATEAAEWIADAPANADSDPEGWQAAIVCGLLAQAEATLALVEQQRLANLIALADSTTSTVAHRQAEGALYGRVVTHVGIEQPLRPDVAAALGIEAVDHD